MKRNIIYIVTGLVVAAIMGIFFTSKKKTVRNHPTR